jgi:outer membrane PBP1 activator LpoA protein
MMNPRQRINTLLKEWLDMTHIEAQAVQAGRWSALSRVEKAKAALEKPLNDAIEQWKTEKPEEAAATPCPEEIHRMIAMESHQSRLLAVRKRQVREKMLLVEQALFDLHHLHSSTHKAA